LFVYLKGYAAPHQINADFFVGYWDWKEILFWPNPCVTNFRNLKAKKFKGGQIYIAEHKKDVLQNPDFLMRNSLLFFSLGLSSVVLTGMV